MGQLAVRSFIVVLLKLSAGQIIAAPQSNSNNVTESDYPHPNITEPLSMDLFSYSSSRGYICKSKCKFSKTDGYYWCTTETYSDGDDSGGDGPWDWDYCSPQNGLDYKGNPCLSDCELRNGVVGRWCYIDKDEAEWGYCSLSWYKIPTTTTVPGNQPQLFQWNLYLYSGLNYSGERVLVGGIAGECVDLKMPLRLADGGGVSVDTKGTCAVVYGQMACTGNSIVLKPIDVCSHSDIRTCGFISPNIFSVGSCT